MKLSQQQAQTFITQAWIDVELYKTSSYRFGQSLWNLLPKGVTLHIHATKEDWFYEKNPHIVIEKFYRNCVYGGSSQ